MGETEKKASVWMGAFILLSSIVYLLVVFGSQRWLQILAGIAGLFLAMFLIIQAGIVEYFRKKDYRKLGPGDVVVWLTFIVGAGVLVNSLLLFGIVSQNAPQWILTFSTTTGVITGIIGIILAIVHMAMPRFK